MATKKTTRKSSSALGNIAGSSIPEGMKPIGGGYADTWNPNEGDSIHGPTTSEVKKVELRIGRKVQTRRCVEITDNESGVRLTVWESAALGELFDTLAESGEGTIVFIRFKGLGKAKKAGQNPPKLFEAAVAA